MTLVEQGEIVTMADINGNALARVKDSPCYLDDVARPQVGGRPNGSKVRDLTRCKQLDGTAYLKTTLSVKRKRNHKARPMPFVTKKVKIGPKATVQPQSRQIIDDSDDDYPSYNTSVDPLPSAPSVQAVGQSDQPHASHASLPPKPPTAPDNPPAIFGASTPYEFGELDQGMLATWALQDPDVVAQLAQLTWARGGGTLEEVSRSATPPHSLPLTTGLPEGIFGLSRNSYNVFP